MYNDGAWHVRPGQTFETDMVNPASQKTWTGPIDSQIYSNGLNELCNRTHDNLNRLSIQMQKMDPCLEYGIKHWHPSKRPKTAVPRMVSSSGKVNVMFTDSNTLDASSVRDDSDFIDPPAPVNKFCYLCSTLEEHKRHMLHHKPKKRPTSARPRVEYIAPKPKMKRQHKEDKKPLAKERLYKVDVFTSDVAGAGTSSQVFIELQGSLDVLPHTQLIKKRGSAKMCFVRNSKETFHIKGPFLGMLQILSIEHDGKDANQAWHLDRVEVTDVRAEKTWVFVCREWLSVFIKPLYSNRVDLEAQEKDRPHTEYNIEIHTGKQKMAGTDSKIFVTLHGRHGSSKKIHLVDQSSDKRLFEKNSIDRFSFRMLGLGELTQIRIEHDGTGFAAGWFFDKAIIYSSDQPNHKYYFTYGGWIAKDEGEGKLWRDIKAKKTLPKELKHGTDTKYAIVVKTGDVRFAGTDANVFIQMAGANGHTPKLTLDNPKNNFERKMTDNFEVSAVNVGPLKHIVIGHDNSGPGAGWFLDTVTVRRYVPKDEALARLKTMKKKQKMKSKKVHKTKARKENRLSDDSDSDYDIKERIKEHKKEQHEAKKKRKAEAKKDKGNYFTVSSESSDSSSSSDSDSDVPRKKGKDKKQPARPGSALRRSPDRDARGRRRSSSVDSEELDRSQQHQQGRRLSQRRVSTSTSSRLHQDDDGRKELTEDRRRRSADGRKQLYSGDGRKREKDDGKRKKKAAGDVDDDENLTELRVPLYEEYSFSCRKWLAVDEDDGLCIRELPVEKKTTYYKD